MLEIKRETVQPAPAQPVMPYGLDLAMHVQNLTCRYGKKLAVDNVSLHVPVGSVYGFLGPNGAGKTTTIKTLIGLRPMQSGRVNMLGMDLASSPEKIRERVGYMSETSNLYRFMRVREIVEVARRLSKRWNAESVQHYLDLFELSPKAKVQSLSKGQKGQLALTLALGSEPDLLILDEPTSGLDPLKRFEFLNQIVREVSQAGRTIFFSSHNLNEVEQIADRVAILNNGKLIVEDELDNLRLHQKSIKVSFDQPVWAYELENIPGVKQVMQEGRRFRLLVRGEVELVAAELRKLGASHLQIVDMNLEAMFVAYLQGYKSDS
jgi:ABC-2 type transport system ATP-binding protein